MKEYFQRVSEYLFNNLESNEILILNFDAEQTDFVRFNHAKIRQAGNVNQATLTLSLVSKKKSLNSIIRLSLDYHKDSVLLLRTLHYLRREIPELPHDPYLMYERNINSFDREANKTLLDSFNITDSILDNCHALDMVGILSSGGMMKGFSNSLGQFNWHENQSFNFDWSMYTNSGRAIKQNYSDQAWDQKKFLSLIDESKHKLSVIDNKEHLIEPGEYRVYLSPSALNEIIDMLCWGGFSYKANKIGSSPLHSMMKGEKKLSTIVFACSLKHTKLLHKICVLSGMKVVKIDDKTSNQARKKIVKDFKNNEIKIIFNYGVLSTGFDAPGTDAILIARPTTSPIIYSQMLGRGLRGPKFGGKAECILIDVKDNLIGLPDEKSCFTLFDKYYKS